MSKASAPGKDRYSGWEMNLRRPPFSGFNILLDRVRIFGIFIMLILLVSIASRSQAQVVNDSNYVVMIQQFSGAPGETVKLPIVFKNYPQAIGGFLMRFEYNLDPIETNLLTPIVDRFEVDTLNNDTSYYYKIEMIGRGEGTIQIDLPFDTTFNVTAFHDPSNDTLASVMLIQFIPPLYDPQTEDQPVIEPSQDSSVIMYVHFRVDPGALQNDYTWFDLKDEMGGYRDNQFTNDSGTLVIYPILYDNYFVVDTSSTPNSAPTVADIIPSTYNVQPGQPLSTITVTASDPDGDSLYLQAFNMPTGATFSPSNPVYGKGSVMGTFNWTPSEAQSDQQYAISFQAVDSAGRASVMKSITIVVGGTGNQPPVVSDITPSTYIIEQGESLPSIAVSASDPEGDSLYLEAIGLPLNASFSPSNPVYGKGYVSGSFNWTPSFTDSGLYVINFQATDSLGQKSGVKSIYITVEVIEEDRLFTTSNYGVGTRPTGGIPGAVEVVFPIDLVTTRTVYGINFDMTYPVSIVEIDSIAVTDRTPEYVIYDNLGQFPDSIRIVAFGLNNEPVVEGSSTAILNAYMTVDSNAIPDDYWVHFYDAWESVDPDPEIPSLNLVVDSGIIQVDILGDVNLDKHIDVADVVNVVGYIIGNFGLVKRNFEAANVIQDTIVNVIDLVGVINLIFGLPVNPSPAPLNYDGELATLTIEHDDLFAGQMAKLNVCGEFPDDVAGIQLQIDYNPSAVKFDPPEIPENVDNFSLAYNDDQNGRMRLVVYSNKPWNPETLIPAGISDVVLLPASIRQDIDAGDNTKFRITQAYLSNSNAVEIPVERDDALLPATFVLYQNYPNPFNPQTKIEFEISHSDYLLQNVSLSVLNILGQNVKTLINEEMTPGRYSVTWDATDENGARVATGIYLYRLELGDKSETKKMLLLK